MPNQVEQITASEGKSDRKECPLGCSEKEAELLMRSSSVYLYIHICIRIHLSNVRYRYLREWCSRGLLSLLAVSLSSATQPRWILHARATRISIFSSTLSLFLSLLLSPPLFCPHLDCFFTGTWFMPLFGRSRGETFDPYSLPVRVKLARHMEKYKSFGKGARKKREGDKFTWEFMRSFLNRLSY